MNKVSENFSIYYFKMIKMNIFYYIMAGRAFVVANEVFIMETVVFWHCDNG